jgi:hypothetical protein
MNCGVDIPPTFLGSLASNQCPGCLKQIYSDETKQLMDELADAMAKMPNDPQGIAGWLLSNYQFRKIGDGKPVDKFFGGNSANNSGFDESKLKIAPGYSQFIHNSEAEKLVAKGRELAALKGGGGKLAECVAAIQGVTDPYGDDGASSDVEDHGVATEDQKEYAALKASGIDPFATATPAMLANANPADIVAMELASHPLDEPDNYEAMFSKSEKGRALLMQERAKKIKAQDAILGGGAFRR